MPLSQISQVPRMQTPDIRVALSHFIRQIELGHVRTATHRPKPLHYDPETEELCEFSWPCEPNPDSKTALDRVKRVAPSDLESHRRTHHFLAPCCLCAFIDGEGYTEAQISVVEVLTKDGDRNRSILNGEIVAQCPKQRCGYLVCLERFYQLSHLAVRQCKRRTIPLPIQDLVHVSDIEKSFRRGDGLFQVMPDVVLRGNRKGLNEAGSLRGLWSRLMLGMSEGDFWATFVQCAQCNQVTLREHYAVSHAPGCSMANPSLRKERVHPSIRHHPYRRNVVDGNRPAGMRLLARLDTLVGDEPQYQPMRSLITRRAVTPESTYDYDPEDISVTDPEMWESSSNGAGFETAQEEGSDEEVEDFLGSDDEYRSSGHATNANGGSAGAWWVHDVPDLSSDDSLPGIMTILEETWSRRVTSNVRTQVGDEEGSDTGSGSQEPERYD